MRVIVPPIMSYSLFAFLSYSYVIRRPCLCTTFSRGIAEQYNRHQVENHWCREMDNEVLWKKRYTQGRPRSITYIFSSYEILSASWNYPISNALESEKFCFPKIPFEIQRRIHRDDNFSAGRCTGIRFGNWNFAYWTSLRGQTPIKICLVALMWLLSQVSIFYIHVLHSNAQCGGLVEDEQVTFSTDYMFPETWRRRLLSDCVGYVLLPMLSIVNWATRCGISLEWTNRPSTRQRNKSLVCYVVVSHRVAFEITRKLRATSCK